MSKRLRLPAAFPPAAPLPAAPVPEPIADAIADRARSEAIRAPARGTRTPARARSARRSSPTRNTRPPSLRALQTWFAAVITHPRDVQRGLRSAARRPVAQSSAELIRATPTFSRDERLHVYHYAYHARLIEALADDFPAVQYCLGRADFDHLARAYLVAHPSHSPNINRFGAAFPAFVARLAPARLRVLAGGLAALEWALVEVLHAPVAPAIAWDALQSLPAEAWPATRFTLADTARIIRTAHPVNAYFQAWRLGREPALPARAVAAVLAYRRPDWSIWRMDLTPAMADLIAALARGVPLGRALHVIDRTVPPAARTGVAAEVRTWFREWVVGGCFASIRVPAT